MLKSITAEELGTCEDRECKAPTYNFIPTPILKDVEGYYFCVPCTERDRELEINYPGA